MIKILDYLPLLIAAIATVIVVVTSISPGDTAAIVAVELATRASLCAIFFVAVVSTVIVTVASPVDPDLLKVNFHIYSGYTLCFIYIFCCHKRNILDRHIVSS